MAKSPPITSDFIPSRNKDVLFRRNSDGTVALMRMSEGEFFFTLDGVAAEAWLLMDGTATVEQIQKKLIKKCNPSLDRFDEKILELIEDLQREGLLEAKVARTG